MSDSTALVSHSISFYEDSGSRFHD